MNMESYFPIILMGYNPLLAFISVNNCFMYLHAPILSAYIFTNVVPSY